MGIESIDLPWDQRVTPEVLVYHAMVAAEEYYDRHRGWWGAVRLLINGPYELYLRPEDCPGDVESGLRNNGYEVENVGTHKKVLDPALGASKVVVLRVKK